MEYDAFSIRLHYLYRSLRLGPILQFKSPNLSSACLIVSLALVFTVWIYPLGNASAMSSPGIMIPLYSYPGTIWNELIQEKVAHDSVPVVAIINPQNGPGAKDQNYANGVYNLQKAGIKVLGYVYTNYTSANITSIESEMNLYKNWYGVNGIFFDAMSNVHGNENYYSQLSAYAKSIGLNFTVGNPGADTLPSYIGTVDNIVLHDKANLPSLSFLGGWHANFIRENFSFISYGVNNVNSTYVSNATKFVQYFYVTDKTLPNPFLEPASYLDGLFNLAESSGHHDTRVSLVVNTYSDDDKPLDGLWVTVQSENNKISGFSPFSFTGAMGKQYGITVANYQNYVFDHWGDGSTSETILTTPNGNATLTAYFQTNRTTNQTLFSITSNQTGASGLSNLTGTPRVSNQTLGPTLTQKSPMPQNITSNPEQNMGSIVVNTLYPSGDRADYTILSFKVFQDTNQTMFRQIDSVSGNPFYIGDLPMDHRYKVEAFVDGMCADIEYVSLDRQTVHMKMYLPLPVGMRVDVFYNDGFTPVANATVVVNSQDNNTWATSLTDGGGESLRFWLDPTTENNYYVIEVKVDKGISYLCSPVFLYPGYATVSGYDQNIKVVTPWPPMTNNAIDVRIHGENTGAYPKMNGNLMVEMFDDGGNEIADSQVNPRGEAHFTDIKIGDYMLKEVDVDSGNMLGHSQILFDGKKTDFSIYDTMQAQSDTQTSGAVTDNFSKTP